MRRLFAWEILLSAAISTVMLVLFVTVGDRGLPLRLEAETLNVRFWLRPTHPPPVPVVIIEIDDASIGEIGRWPWSRRIFAELLDRIHTAGARVTCLDLLLTEPEPSLLQTQLETVETAMAPLLRKLDPATRAFAAKLIAELSQNTDPDAQLAAAIERDRPVILPFALDLQPGATKPGGPARPPPVLARAALDRARGDRDELLPPAFGAQLPVAALTGGGLLAHVTTVPDGLGGYLYDYPVLRVADEYLPSLSLEAVRVFLGIPKSDVIVDRGRGIDLGAFYIPTDRGMRLVVNYYPPGTFQKVSFANALFDRAPLQNLNGKIVLIGGGAKALGDAVPTPYDPALSGAERHATLIANFLGRDFLRRDGTTIEIDAVLLVLVSLSVGFFARRGAVPAVIGAVALLTGLVIVDYFAFVRFGLWLNFTFPAAAIVLCAAASVGGKYLGEWRRERYIRDAFSRYLHPHLVEELCRIRAPLRLGGEERELTVMFADIRDFTSIAENLSPGELTALLNEFFAAMTDCVQARRGMLDKYIGDSLMAVFGAPLPDPEHALNACRAAVDMSIALANLHHRWRSAGRPCLEMRIGINTGRMVIGNVGTERHFGYTVIGDEVNVAARLEAANKELGTTILVSAATRRAAGADITARPCGRIEVKGRTQPVAAFELVAFGSSQAPAWTT